MAMYTLLNNRFWLVVNESGGCIDCFELLGERRFDILRPRAAGCGNGAGESAMFPMLPMVNRIRDNRFEWRTNTVTLPVNPEIDNHFFLHGDGWLLNWDVSRYSQSEGYLELAVRSQIPHVCHYQAIQHYQLLPDGVQVTLTLTNLGNDAFPFGAGFHPYFTCLPDSLIAFTAEGAWLEQSNHLPGDFVTPLPPLLDFTRHKVVPDAWINNGYYIGARGVYATITHANGVVVALRSPCHYLQVYKPLGECGFLCLEPQSQAVNAHADLAYLNQGLQVLAPQQSMQVTMKINVRESGCAAIG